ncbi:MAG: ribosome-binding factor A [Candidatus Andersenbacteria bacterium]|nr:ribosome-binding factor A [Candidatus Andersenbacteria bacterium]MBI3250731.1 ribosome-binding factor A [Candidatus Andersenbacteria bacterium]
MSRRIEKINKHIQKTLGEIFQRETDIPPDVLVTISRVDTTPNLQSAAVWLYIQPLERGEDTLELLKKQLYDIQGALNRALQMRPLPRITLRLDLGSYHAQKLEEKLDEIKNAGD